MKTALRKMMVPATVSLLLVAPFVILEAVNTAGFATYGFPTALFGVMWLTGFVFAVLLPSVVQGVRSNGMTLHPASFVVRTALMVLIAVTWAGLLNDQMPCFLGVPNCD